ncbi:MAG TPA: ABC transporter permease [Baekduia sp.]|nr:ABC transporter permease [Baekduia sp.]
MSVRPLDARADDAGTAMTPPPGAQEMRGPSALGGDTRRFLYLSWTLAVTDFRLKFFGSVLGYLWQLMRPLMLFGVIYLVFVEFVNLGGGQKDWPLVILSGIMFFTFFSEATGGSVTSVVDRENLVRKIRFPRMVIPTAVLLTALMNFVLNLIVLLVFILVTGVDVTWRWIEAPVLIVAITVLALGMAMLLSSLYVIARDVKPIWDVALQVLFYGTPLLYPIETVSMEWARHLLMANPVAVIVQQWRFAVIDPTAPSAAAAAGGWLPLLIPLTIGVGVVAGGFVLFNRIAPRIAEEL